MSLSLSANDSPRRLPGSVAWTSWFAILSGFSLPDARQSRSGDTESSRGQAPDIFKRGRKVHPGDCRRSPGSCSSVPGRLRQPAELSPLVVPSSMVEFPSHAAFTSVSSGSCVGYPDSGSLSSRSRCVRSGAAAPEPVTLAVDPKPALSSRVYVVVGRAAWFRPSSWVEVISKGMAIMSRTRLEEARSVRGVVDDSTRSSGRDLFTEELGLLGMLNPTT